MHIYLYYNYHVGNHSKPFFYLKQYFGEIFVDTENHTIICQTFISFYNFSK